MPQNRSKDICILHVKWSWENQNCSSSLPLTDTLFFFRIPWSISDFRRLKNVWDFWWRTKYKTDGRAVRAERILSRWGSEIFFQSRWGSEPIVFKYYSCFLENSQNLGEDQSSDSHRFRPGDGNSVRIVHEGP